MQPVYFECMMKTLTMHNIKLDDKEIDFSL